MNQERIDEINDKMPHIIQSFIESFQEQGYNPQEAVSILSSCIVTILHRNFDSEITISALENMKKSYIELLNARIRSS